jgi:hypothetical protein
MLANLKKNDFGLPTLLIGKLIRYNYQIFTLFFASEILRSATARVRINHFEEVVCP